MYVCVCNAVNDRQVKKALDDGILSIRGLRMHLGFESCCGRCTDCMRDLIRKHQQSANNTIQGDP